MSRKYRVSADIEYLDGTLQGLTIPAGFSVTYPDRTGATRCSMWLNRVKRENDFVRACVTGNRYRVCGNICIDTL